MTHPCGRLYTERTSQESLIFAGFFWRVLGFQASADPDCPDFSTGWTPLMSASRQGRNDIMTLLLDHGADPDCDVTPAMNHLTWQTTTR